MIERRIVLTLVVLVVLAVTAMGLQGSFAQSGSGQPPAAAVTPDPWPKIVKQEGATYTLYQPQLDSWNGCTFAAHAAVSVLPAGAKDPDFGDIEFTAKTHVFRLARVVHFRDITVVKATFPATPDKAAWYRQGFQTMVTGGDSTMSLDRLQAMLSIEDALQMGRAVPVKNDPPTIVFTPRTGVLVSIDGEPVWRSVAGTSLEEAKMLVPFGTRVVDSQGKGAGTVSRVVLHSQSREVAGLVVHQGVLNRREVMVPIGKVAGFGDEVRLSLRASELDGLDLFNAASFQVMPDHWGMPMAFDQRDFFLRRRGRMDGDDAPVREDVGQRVGDARLRARPRYGRRAAGARHRGRGACV